MKYKYLVKTRNLNLLYYEYIAQEAGTKLRNRELREIVIVGIEQVEIKLQDAKIYFNQVSFQTFYNFKASNSIFKTYPGPFYVAPIYAKILEKAINSNSTYKYLFDS